MRDLKYHKEQLVNVDANNDYKDKLLHSREREIIRNIYNKKLDKIDELTKKIDEDNLTYATKSTGKTIDFSKKYYPLTFFNKIKKMK